MRRTPFPCALLLAASVAVTATAQGRAPRPTSSPASRAVAPALDAIRDADLRRDLFALADDAFRGREAGTLDELRASVWVAERAREAGLEPAGDHGSWFQWFHLRRTRFADDARVLVDSAPLALWRDVIAASPATAHSGSHRIVRLTLPADTSGPSLEGVAVVVPLPPPPTPPAEDVSLREWRYARGAIAYWGARIARRNPAAIVFVADSTAEASWPFFSSASSRGAYGLDSAGADADARPRAARPVLLVRRETGERLRAGATLRLELTVESHLYPSVNVVGRVRGTDPRRRDEHVLFSAHQDHDGVRAPIAGDSIWNGADDNVTTSVAVLAIARAFAKRPAARSALFVWHGAEERGLIGSRHHARNPVVPRGQLVAVLNGDMLGRNHPDSAALLGAQPPHRNSSALVAMALEANAATARFALDTLWDRPTHPEGWYFRSDHLPYARLGVPALFFTTNLHAEYHTPRDEAKTIDVPKLGKVTRWMYVTGWLAANAAARPAVDPGFRLER